MHPDRSPNPRPATLKRINMRRFLEELRVRGPSTRAELTRAIGVTAPTSSSIIADLLETGLLEEADGLAPSKGRPGKVFRLATSSAYVLGATIDVGQCAVAVSGLDGVVRAETRQTFDTPHQYEALVEQLALEAERLRRRTAGACHGFAVAVPGLVQEALGRAEFSPNLHFLDGRELGADLARRLGLKVVCTQEEHALCLSEQRKGRAKGLADFAVMDFGSGVGMGVVSGGRYVRGSHGYAGEIGHTTVEPNGRACGCGNRGCLETVASDTALLRAVSQRLGRTVSFDELAHLDLERELESTLTYLAIGIATVVNLFNPSAVFVHGQLFRLRADLLDDLFERVRARALGPSTAGLRLRLAEGDKLHGAVAGLLDAIFASVGPALE